MVLDVYEVSDEPYATDNDELEGMGRVVVVEDGEEGVDAREVNGRSSVPARAENWSVEEVRCG